MRGSRAGRVVIALAVAAILVFIAMGSPAVRHQLALSFTRVPTRYTELYFGDYAAIPQTLSVKHPSRFTFTIHNREGKLVNYGYRVTTTSRIGESTVATGHVTIASGRTASEIVAFRPMRPRVSYRVTVSVSGPDPEIIEFTAQS
jgi:hypothetical protein